MGRKMCWFASEIEKHSQHKGDQRPIARLQNEEHVSMAAELYSKFIKLKKSQTQAPAKYLRTLRIQGFGKVLSGIVFSCAFFTQFFPNCILNKNYCISYSLSVTAYLHNSPHLFPCSNWVDGRLHEWEIDCEQTKAKEQKKKNKLGIFN